MMDVSERETKLTPAARTVAILALAIPIALAAFWALRSALLIIYVSAVFAVVLKPGVEWLHSRNIYGHHLGRGTALLLLILLICLFLGGMLALALPSVVEKTAEFSGMLAAQSGRLQQRLHAIPLLKQVNLAELQARAAALLAQVLPALFGATTAIITGILLTAYFILDGAALLHRALCVLRPDAGNGSHPP